MSKDKGSKNKKKLPADKTPGTEKKLSAYQSENKNALNKQTTLDAFTPKNKIK
jgi:hypothetical protein